MLVIGVDEAGRGPLVGSVVAAAVAFPPGFKIDGLTDSKKLSEKKRDALYNQITSECYWSYAQSNSQEIDDINILEATMLAMKRAVDQIKIAMGNNHQTLNVLVDGNRRPDIENCQAIIKGDLIEPAISAASIIAKAGLSLTLPPGFVVSTFAITGHGIPSVTRTSRTMGVRPIS